MTGKKKEWTANGILAASAGIACLSAPYTGSFAGGLLFHTALAATVGGIADWFAVNSLFRKPLGLSFRTELVQKNRERIIHMAREMVEDEILTLPRLYRVLKQHSAGAASFSWLTSHKGEVQAFLGEAVCLAMEKGNLLPAARLGEQALKEAAGQADWGEALGGAAARMDGKALWPALLPLFSEAAHALGSALFQEEILVSLYQDAWKRYEAKNKSRAMLKGLLESQMGLTDARAAALIQGKAGAWISGLADPGSPASKWALERLEELQARMAGEKELQKKAGEWMARQIASWLDQYGTEAIEELLRNHKKDCARKVAAYILEKGLALLRDPGKRALFDWWFLKQAVVCLPYLHEKIGHSVEQALEGYSGNDMARIAEESTAHDLQMIRVNGSLVGAVLGCAAYLAFYILSGGGAL